MGVPTEINKAPARRPEGRNGLMRSAWQAQFRRFVVKKLCLCCVCVCVCNSPLKAEGGYVEAKWKPEFIFEQPPWCFASKAIRKALEGLSAGASVHCNIVHVHKP